MTNGESVCRWDAAAGNYQQVFQQGINEYNRAALQRMQEKGMIFPGARVLDIGCGVGKYGTYLAALGCRVTLTDISPKMLEHARSNMEPWPETELICGDFSGAILTEEKYHRRFDLVMSTMSPAVSSGETIRKACGLSKGWVYLTNFYHWKQPARDEIMRCAGLELRGSFDRTSLVSEHERLLSVLDGMSVRYELDFVPYTWSDRRTVEEMTRYMRNTYSMQGVSLPVDDEKLTQAVLTMADEDGRIEDRVETTVARILWKTTEKK